MVDIAVIATTFLTAVAYSLFTYSGRYLKNGETFVPLKFFRTLLVGVIVGVAVVTTGRELTLAGYEQIAASVGAVHIADVVVTTVWERAVDKGFLPPWLSGEIELDKLTK
jgi:FtsH-binding integral membrane protein